MNNLNNTNIQQIILFSTDSNHTVSVAITSRPTEDRHHWIRKYEIIVSLISFYIEEKERLTRAGQSLETTTSSGVSANWTRGDGLQANFMTNSNLWGMRSKGSGEDHTECSILNLFETDSMEPTEPVSTEAVAGLPPPSFSPSKLGHWLSPSPSPAFDSRSKGGQYITGFPHTI